MNWQISRLSSTSLAFIILYKVCIEMKDIIHFYNNINIFFKKGFIVCFTKTKFKDDFDSSF